MPTRLEVLWGWLTSRFTRSVGVYAASNAISAAIPFALLPILTAYLSPADYGMVAMFQLLIGVLAAFVGISVHNSVARQYYERHKIDFPSYVSSCLALLVGSTVVVSLLLWLTADWIERWTGVPSVWLWLVVAVAVAQFLTKLVLALWQVRMRPWSYAAFQVLLTATNFGLTICFVVGTHAGWEGRVEAQLLAYAIFAGVALLVLLRDGYLVWRINAAMLRQALGYGLPLVPHILGALTITMTDRALLVNMIGLEAAGIYIVGMQIGFSVGILQDSFHKGWIPWFYAQLERNNAEQNRRIVKVIYAYDFAILAVALAVGLAAPLLFSLMIGPEFAGGSQVVMWIALGYAFNGMYKMRSGYLFYENKTHLLALVTGLAAIVNIIVSYLLIRVNGYVGAAQGTMIAMFVAFVATWVLSTRVHDVPWRLRAAT